MLTPTIERYMTRAPFAVVPTDNLLRARSLMEHHAIRHLPVVDGERLVGVISEREVALLERVPGISLEHVEIARVMAPAVTACVDDALEDVSMRMADKRCDCVVVQRGTTVTGIFTATDALVALGEVVRRACA